METYFVPLTIYTEFQKLGLEKGKDIYPFKIGDEDGVLIPGTAIKELIGKTGMKMVKAASLFEDIYTVVGYTLPDSTSDVPVSDIVASVYDGTVMDPGPLKERLDNVIQELISIKESLEK